MKDFRNPLPDRDHHRQREISLTDTSPKKITFEHHLRILGLSPHKSSDQQARTNETSSSELDGQSMRREESSYELLHQAYAHYEQGEHDKAEQLFRFFIDNSEQNPQPDGLMMALAVHGLGNVFMQQKNFGDAEQLLKWAIDYYAQKPDELKIALAMNDIAKIWTKQGSYKEAKEVNRSVLSIYKKCGENDPVGIALTLQDLAKNYTKQERYDKAKALYEYALPIYEKNFGENHPATEKVRKKLADLPMKSGKVDQSKAIENLINKRLQNPILNHIKSCMRFPDIRNPVLFTDKTLHRNLFDSRPIRNQFADKYAVRKYVEDKIGAEYLPELYCETTDPNTIPFGRLPDKFVIKSTQGTGRVIVVRDKSTINELEIIKKCQQWVDSEYYQEAGESAHKHTPQRIIVEEYIDDGNGLAPNDYKFYTYGGVPHFIQLDTSRFEGHKIDLYNARWEKLPCKKSGFDSNPAPLPPPRHLELMLKLAQKLGEGIDFARIDFYDTPDKVYLGEMTNLPGVTADGVAQFEPAMYDRMFGAPWKIYDKSTVQSLGPSSDVCEIMRQATRGMYQLLEGQSKRNSDSILFDDSPKKRWRKEDFPIND
jgi:tetratricopeptide (TPR) repeat protein